MSKEEGEITDDDDVDCSTSEETGNRHYGSSLSRRQLGLHYCYHQDYSDRRVISRLENGLSNEKGSNFPSRHRGESSSFRKHGASSIHDSRQRFTAGSAREGKEVSQMCLPSSSRGEYSRSLQYSNYERPEDGGYKSYRSYKDRQDQEQFSIISDRSVSDSAKSWRRRKFCPSYSAGDGFCDNDGSTSSRQNGEQSNPANPYELLVREYQRVREKLDAYEHESEGGESPVSQHHLQAARAKSRDRKIGHSTSLKSSRDSECPLSLEAFDGSSIGVTQPGRSQQNGSKSVAEVVTATLNFSAEVSVQAVDSSVAIPLAVDVKAEIVGSGRDTGDDFGGVKTDDGGVAASPTSVVKDSGTSECRTSLLFQQSVLDSAASNTENLDADEEEELDELELRRIALESAARRMACDDDTDVTVLSSSSVDLIQAEESVIGQPGSKDKTSATLCSWDTSSQAKSLPSKSLSSSLGAVAKDRQLAQRQAQDTFHSQRLPTRSEKALPERTPERDKKSGHGSSSAKGSGSKRMSAKQQGITNNMSPRSAREKSVPPRRNRPLPFAPTRLDKITVKATRGNSGRSSEISSQAQKKARHVSVVRKVSRTPKTNSKSLEKHASNKLPAHSPAKNQRRYGDKDKEEKRRQEIAKILSLEDPKEQVDRFLRFLNVTIAENSQGKQQQLRDNYEEVEMDIDSGDEGGLRMGELPAALQPLRLMGADVADFQCPADLLQGLGQWMAPFPYMDSYSGMMHFPSLLPSAPPHPAMPSVPLPALPQAAPSQPPLPEDVPQPPPPPPPDAESLIEGKDLINDSDSGGFRNKIDTRASFMLGEVQYQADQASARPATGGKAGLQGCDDIGSLPDKSGYTLAVDEGSPKSEAKASADEEEEVELRKQLLEDLIKRKEQAESKRPESGGSSPAKFDAVSPLCLFRPRDVPHKAQINSRRYLLPMHKPVVVPLCNSSSEDEGEDLKNMASAQRNKRDITDFDIDSFLKVQRKTVEEQKLGSPVKDQKIKLAAALPNKALYPEQHQHLQQQEAELAKLRQLIMKDQAHVQEVMARGNRILAEQKRAEAVVKRLQEQLLVALKLVTNKSTLVERAKTQFRQTRERLVQKQDLYKHMEEKTMSLGQKLLGADYRPRIALPSSGIKRKVEVAGKHQGLSITVVGKDTKKRKVEGNSSEKENILSTAVPASSIAEKRAAEKAHLQNLAKEYEEKIRHLKMLQMQRNLSGLPPGAANTKNTQPLTKQAAGLVISLPNSKNVRLASLESIKLEPVDSDSVVQKFRRRSLLDMEQSPKPNLLLKEHHSAKKPDTASEANSQSPVSKKKSVPAKFRMPSGVQLKNLCKIQKEKVSKILSSQSCPASEVFSNLSPHCDPISELNIIYLQEQKRQEKRDLANLAYTSPLLHFKAYRFSPYYRTKESLIIPSASFSNKLNPSRILCRYELQGICNDQQCPWQHARDYRLTEKELLQDLVAYCPKLAGIVDSDDQNSVAKKIDAYVESLLAQHKGKMTFDDICLLLTSKVNECAEHVRPHTMFFESRLWLPNIEEARSFSMTISSDFQAPLNITGETTAKPEMDAVLDSEDVRYFVPDSEAGGDVQDMEGAVLSTPGDTDLWLRLAYSKLSNPSRSKEESLNQALNVLSRGLESNKESSDLWTHYLNLYHCHGDASFDFVDVCNTALEYAACYEIWWQLLEASMGFQAKDSACNKALNFLCKEEGCLLQSDTKDEVRSHQILEMILYKVTLNSQSGRFKTAVNFFQSVVGVREGMHGEGRYRQHLTHPDTCVLWVCLVHLMEFQTLPAALYDPANQNPGRIMSKKSLWIPWHSKRELSTVFDTVVLYLSQAATPVDSAPLPCYTSPQYVQAVLNLTQLLCYRNKYMEACEVLKRVLEWAPHLEDLWLMSADIYAGVDDMDSARQVILESVASNKYSAKLHYHLAMLELLQNCADEALELMERFVISHFSVSDEDMTKVDPNFLFCKILGLDVPVMKKLPSLQDDVKESLSSRDVHLWLCYCLLLELQGETSEAVDVFEHALSSTIDAADLCLLWKSYVQFLYRRLHSCPPGLVPATLQQIQEAMLRSVTTAPTLLPTPGPSRRHPQRQLWRDFSHVTSLVDFYVQLVPADAQATALQTFLDLMPANVALLIRCVEAAVKDGQRRRARSLCTTAVYDRVANLQLWKLALSLAQEEGTPREVERLYVRAVRAMPLSVSLWKDFLLYEVSQENSTAVQSILTQCQGLGLNIQGYVATISSSSSAS